MRLAGFVESFSEELRKWATALQSQTFFFDNVIGFHTGSEEAAELQSRAVAQK